MALNTDKNLKKYYNIGEVADQFGVATSVLRYWEKQFPTLIKPQKAGRSVRQYTVEDIEDIRLVYNLLKVRGMKIAAAREGLNKNKEGAADTMQVINKLQSIREELVGIRKEIDQL